MSVALKLPILWVFENNGYGEFTGADFAVGSKDIAGRAAGFGIPTEKVDGTDFFAVTEAAGTAIERIRQGSGPQGIEALAYRFYGHFEGDPQNYRSREEVEKTREESDCLKNFRASVTDSSRLQPGELDAVDAEVAELIDAAVAEARAADFPSPDRVLKDVYISY